MTSHRWHQFVLGVVTAVILCTCATNLAWAGNLFSGPINSPAGRYPWALASGDFNLDGKADLAVTNLPANQKHNQVKVLLGEGSGVFQKPTGYRVGNSPFSVAVGDFNRDGKPDLVVTNSVRIGVLLGNGDGTFQKQVTYKTGSALGVAVADFNGDAKLDMAVIGRNRSQTMAILLGNGDGTFQPQIRVPALGAPWRIVAGDLNGDGIPDLVISGGNNKRAIISLLGNGDGTFRIVWTPKNPPYSAIALGDFNGDGKLDLAEAGGISPGRLKIWLGNGDGTFQAAAQYDVAETVGALTVSDFDGDGNLDVAVVFGQGSSIGVSVFLGLGNGKFQQPQTYVLSPVADPIEMIAADVNGDGRPDLVVTDLSNHVVSVLLNTGNK